jgi:hypothetical protein
MWGALSDERTGLSFKLLLALATAVILGYESRGTHDCILLSQIRDTTNLVGQVPAFISPRNRVAQLYPQAPGSPFVASTTRRATVEVFGPASKQGTANWLDALAI